MIRVDYAGPGGACEGIRSLGLESFGIEWDAAACQTRAAAGHVTIRADLATYRPHHRPGSVVGYWASPPCQTFSMAGKGDGRDQLEPLAASIHARRWADANAHDPRTRHVLDACRTAAELRPEWVVFEQVPAVLPLWRAMAHVLEVDGYSTWAGVLCAADYGVPQTRRRAFLLASRVRAVSPPVPSHAESPGLFSEQPWVSWGDALGVELATAVEIKGAGMVERFGPPHQVASSKPYPTLTDGAGYLLVGGTQSGPQLDSMTTTHAGGRKLSILGRLQVQGFPLDYPMAGPKKGLQVANAVPPPMAAAVVAAVTGRAMEV